MFVLDGAKARLIAIALTAATALPLLPRTDVLARSRASDEQAAEVTKAPKKSKRKQKSSTAKRMKLVTPRLQPWGIRPEFNFEEAEKKQSRVKLVLASAKKQLGKPYRYGAVGPSSFDCSGFTRFAWKSAGIVLPHNSSAQRAATKQVPLNKMKPGDLVFAPGHVGLYLGDGKMIHSPQTGDRVKISPIHGNTYGAGRPAA